MDIFDKALEIWKGINDPISVSFEKRIIFNNEFIGKENNCLSSIPKSIIILDGELNQFHIVKNKIDSIFHQTVLMTPQPLEKFTRLELSPNKVFLALIGKDSVSLVDMCNLSSSSKTCKKIKEIFTTKDVIIDVKWYPNMHDYLVILTRQSFIIYHIGSNLSSSSYYQFNLYEEVMCHSKSSIGFKEEYIGFDFGSVTDNSDDNCLFILKDTGDVYLLPGLRAINNRAVSPFKLLFDPPSSDNYQDEFSSIIVLRGAIDLLVLANQHGTIQHALFINNKICVYESITIEVTETVNKTPLHLLSDDTSYPPRYFLVHSGGIQTCILPWVVRLRLALKSFSQTELESCVKNCGNTVFDHVLKTNLSTTNNQNQVRFGGITVIRNPSLSPVLYVMHCREQKMHIRLKLRQESSFMLKQQNVDRNDKQDLRNNEYHMKTNSETKFISKFQSELNKARKLPILASGMNSNDTSDMDKLTLVLQMNEVASAYSYRLSSSGQLFEQRLKQINTLVESQKDQVCAIQAATHELKNSTTLIISRYERAISRQQNLLRRLSDCSHKISEMNGVSPRADKDAKNVIVNVQKQLASMQTLLRSCNLRYLQSQDFIDQVQKENTKPMELNESASTDLQSLLQQDDSDIQDLIADVKNLMEI